MQYNVITGHAAGLIGTCALPLILTKIASFPELHAYMYTPVFQEFSQWIYIGGSSVGLNQKVS
jgi:hypothetical protein